MVSSFPRLIAAAHVLHRLLAPRHPPCALVLLIRKNTFYCCYGVFKVRVSLKTRTSRAHEKNRPQVDGLSKLNSVDVEVDVFQASPGTGRFRRAIDGTGRLPE